MTRACRAPPWRSDPLISSLKSGFREGGLSRILTVSWLQCSLPLFSFTFCPFLGFEKSSGVSLAKCFPSCLVASSCRAPSGFRQFQAPSGLRSRRRYIMAQRMHRRHLRALSGRRPRRRLPGVLWYCHIALRRVVRELMSSNVTPSSSCNNSLRLEGFAGPKQSTGDCGLIATSKVFQTRRNLVGYIFVACLLACSQPGVSSVSFSGHLLAFRFLSGADSNRDSPCSHQLYSTSSRHL